MANSKPYKNIRITRKNARSSSATILRSGITNRAPSASPPVAPASPPSPPVAPASPPVVPGTRASPNVSSAKKDIAKRAEEAAARLAASRHTPAPAATATTTTAPAATATSTSGNSFPTNTPFPPTSFNINTYQRKLINATNNFRKLSTTHIKMNRNTEIQHHAKVESARKELIDATAEFTTMIERLRKEVEQAKTRKESALLNEAISTTQTWEELTARLAKAEAAMVAAEAMQVARKGGRRRTQRRNSRRSKRSRKYNKSH